MLRFVTVARHTRCQPSRWYLWVTPGRWLLWAHGPEAEGAPAAEPVLHTVHCAGSTPAYGPRQQRQTK